MPVYRTTIREGLSSVPQRARIAKEIVNIHCGVTGAPRSFVNAFFSEVSSGEHPKSEVGSGELPEGKVAFVHATIRAGRDAAAKTEIVTRLTDVIVETLGCGAEEVDVVTDDIPAYWCMEGGKVLPIPGSPEEAEWKRHE